MALSGELSDLSLAELIEFFCNQRKTGRLKIAYERAPGFFYFQNGVLADARIGVLRGVEAVYYALTLENAQFKFSPSFPPEQRTINQPWAQVALEGLRRMDEGVEPLDAFPVGGAPHASEENEPVQQVEPEEAIPEYSDESPFVTLTTTEHAPEPDLSDSIAPPLSLMVETNSGSRRKFAMIAAVVAVLLITAAIGVPAGWYGKRTANAASQPAPAPTEVVNPTQTATAPVDVPVDPATTAAPDPSAAAAEQAKANHEMKDRAKQEEKARLERERLAAANGQPVPAKPDAGKPGPKMVTVQVTYDENGRVTQASGADASATRIARQRRFPAGKAGTATVTIPLN
jgi:hypothetical protein